MTSYTDMEPGDMLQAVADDGMKWAEAFAEQCPDIPQDVMFGWFANTIENTWDTRCSRLARDAEAWASFKEQMEQRRAFWSEIAQ